MKIKSIMEGIFISEKELWQAVLSTIYACLFSESYIIYFFIK